MSCFIEKSSYVYLLQVREFVNSNQNVYKLGKTTQSNYKRFNSYPNDSILFFQTMCYDCDKVEKELIDIFKQKYIYFVKFRE